MRLLVDQDSAWPDSLQNKPLSPKMENTCFGESIKIHKMERFSYNHRCMGAHRKNMHRKMTLKASAIIIPACLSGCSTESIRIKETVIQQETIISMIAKDELSSMIDLNKNNSKEDVFQNAKMLDTGKYQIVYNNDSEEIFIIKDGMVLIGLRGDAKYTYNESPFAPFFGSEVSVVDGNYIKYNGPTRSFEDYGLNGVNIISNI